MKRIIELLESKNIPFQNHEKVVAVSRDGMVAAFPAESENDSYLMETMATDTEGGRMEQAMRVCSKAHSYKTRENVVRKLQKELTALGFNRVRWFIIAQDLGYSPAVVLDGRPELLSLTHRNVVVVGD